MVSESEPSVVEKAKKLGNQTYKIGNWKKDNPMGVMNRIFVNRTPENGRISAYLPPFINIISVVKKSVNLYKTVIFIPVRNITASFPSGVTSI